MCDETGLLDVSKELQARNAALERQRERRIDIPIDAPLGISRRGEHQAVA
jgi:hypothetical protein